ncbi:MAG: hypothetical protein E6R03_04245 [Hyphomicrobiaceae bacterium]|nr:MAG: hypothetical protein E6R03_04245 [Hyphomicrobiaceae bacterium]
MPTLAFDVRYDNGAGIGLQVDAGIYVEIYENEVTLKDTRTKGTDPKTTVVELQDGAGYLYRTIVDLTGYLIGPVRAVWHATKNSSPISDFAEVLDWPTMPGAFTSKSVSDYIAAKLGAPVIGVELVPTQVSVLIQESLRTYNTLVGRQRKKKLTLGSAQQGYPLPDVGSRGVCKVEFVKRNGIPLLSDPFFGREFARNSPMDFDAYALGNSYWKAMQRVGSQEPDWHWDQTARTLYVDMGPANMSLQTMYDVTYWYYEDIGIQEIPSTHVQVFLDLALGSAKMLVGEMRDKFGGSGPGPGGGVTMNGAALKGEGQQMMEAARATLTAIGMADVVPEFG